jgi:hypothetical protein
MDFPVANALQMSPSRREDRIKRFQKGSPWAVTRRSSILSLSKRTFPIQSQVSSPAPHPSRPVHDMPESTAAAPAIPSGEQVFRLGQHCLGPRMARLLEQDEVLPIDRIDPMSCIRSTVSLLLCERSRFCPMPLRVASIVNRIAL